jgi:hypothetical protein
MNAAAEEHEKGGEDKRSVGRPTIYEDTVLERFAITLPDYMVAWLERKPNPEGASLRLRRVLEKAERRQESGLTDWPADPGAGEGVRKSYTLLPEQLDLPKEISSGKYTKGLRRILRAAIGGLLNGF